jgi:hypothetical protein
MNQNPHQWPSQVFHVVAPRHLPVKHGTFHETTPKKEKKNICSPLVGTINRINKILTLIGLRFFQKIEWFTWPAT